MMYRDRFRERPSRTDAGIGCIGGKRTSVCIFSSFPVCHLVPSREKEAQAMMFDICLCLSFQFLSFSLEFFFSCYYFHLSKESFPALPSFLLLERMREGPSPVSFPSFPSAFSFPLKCDERKRV